MKEVMNVGQVAEYLNIKVVTVYKHARQGCIPCFKVGSNLRFRREAIDKWIKNQEKLFKNKGK